MKIEKIGNQFRLTTTKIITCKSAEQVVSQIKRLQPTKVEGLDLLPIYHQNLLKSKENEQIK
jgi:hypothetical protein